jgi:hypothetical protein
VAFVGCQVSGTPTAPSVAAASPVAQAAAATETAITASRANTALVCHRDGTGDFAPLYVNPQAVPAHLGHGDGQVGSPVPGGQPNAVFGANCAMPCPCELLYQKANVLYTLKGGRQLPVLTSGIVAGESVATCAFGSPPEMTWSSKASGASGLGCSATVDYMDDPIVFFAPASKTERESCAALLQSTCH